MERPIVYFGNDWQAENRTSSHHVARCLAATHPLLYIDSPTRAPRATGRDLKKAGRILKKILARPKQIGDRMWQMTVPQLPFRRIPIVKAINRWFGILMVKRALRYVGFQNPILWFAAPAMAPVVGRVGERFVVYYCIDDYAGLPHMDRQEVAALDDLLTRKADQVFVSSMPLLEVKKAIKPTTRYSPHGVDVSLFARACDPAFPMAEGMRGLTKPVIGFYGSISGWIDIALVTLLAKAHPEWTFVMIGLVSVDLGELPTLANVKFFPAQRYETLPEWVKGFDVGLQPYVLNSQTYHSNPLKLREYLAAGKPVVSISIPEVDRFADYVGIARNHDEYLQRVEEAVAGDTEEKREARRALVARMSWEARVDEAWKIVEAQLGGDRVEHVPQAVCE